MSFAKKIKAFQSRASLDFTVCSYIFADLVCQSGPGPWPSEVYAQSAIYPMAHSAAQVNFFSNSSNHSGSIQSCFICELILFSKC